MKTPKKKLLIFIDSLADYYLDEYCYALPFIASLPVRSRICPGIGYSINIKAEMFGGYKPDSLGYFCKWTHVSNSRFKKWQPIFNCLKLFSLSHTLDRVSHRVLSKLINVDLFTIPYGQISLFDMNAPYEAYEESFPLPTLFSKYWIDCIIDKHYQKTGIPDELVVEETYKRIKKGDFKHLFVALVDLDRISHKHGIGSDKQIIKLQWVDKTVQDLSRFFLDNYDGEVLIFGDHGMCERKDQPRINFEKHFGKVSVDRYIYFVDTTLIRIWVNDLHLGNEICSYLDSLNFGKRLTEHERSNFGVTNRKFGNYIYLVNEGRVPSPSHVSGMRIKAAAVHGYDPRLKSQKAAFLSVRPLTQEVPLEMSSIELYSLLDSIF